MQASSDMRNVLTLWLCLMFYGRVIIEIRIYAKLIAIVSLGIGLFTHKDRKEKDAEGVDLGKPHSPGLNGP